MTRKLSRDEAERVARDADRVFNVPLSLPEIFRPDMPHRLLVETSAFTFSKEQFEALCQAVASVHDQALWLALTGNWLEDGDGDVLALAWEVPLDDYEGYADAPHYDKDVGRELGIPLYRILFSPTGQWGVLLDDFFAVLGGSAEFIETFKQAYPKYSEELAEFLEGMAKAGRTKGADTRWVPPLLQHVYGAAAPSFPPDRSNGVSRP